MLTYLIDRLLYIAELSKQSHMIFLQKVIIPAILLNFLFNSLDAVNKQLSFQ